MPAEKTNIYANAMDANNGVLKMFRIWKGSIAKLIWLELLVFILCYGFLAFMYRAVFMQYATLRDAFEIICIYSNRFNIYIPVTFLTGFYVANVLTRYWNQFLSIAWPDSVAFKLVAFIPGQGEYERTLRRTIARYMNVATLLVFRLVSKKVKERFPDYNTIVSAGLLLPEEARILTDTDEDSPYDTTWIPLLWIHTLLAKEKASGRLNIDPYVYTSLISSFDYLENCNRSILNYAWVNIPTAYTQVAFLSVYCYMFSTLFARQFLVPRGESNSSDIFMAVNVSFSGTNPFAYHTPGIYFPFYTIIEFICYVGWFKMTEGLLNPWGDDDVDFQINYLIDRNFQTTFLIVDESIRNLKLRPDIYQATNMSVPPEVPDFLTPKNEFLHDKTEAGSSGLKKSSTKSKMEISDVNSQKDNVNNVSKTKVKP